MGSQEFEILGCRIGYHLVFLLLNYSGSDSSYYQEGYNYGYEVGKYDGSMGRAVQSEAEKTNMAGMRFIKKYGYVSSGEMHDAEKEYRNGYTEGYIEGFRNGK